MATAVTIIVIRRVTIIVTTTVTSGIAHVRSRATYRLKIIARSSSIIDQLLGLIYISFTTSVTTSVATSVHCLNLYRDIYNL